MINKHNINNSKPFITKDSSIIQTIIDSTNADVKKVSLAEAALKPGKSTIEHYHKKTEEIYYFTSGTGIMWVKGKKITVKKGDGVLTPASAAHRVKNTGKGMLRFLCACSPPYRHDDTVITNYNFKMIAFDFDGTLVDSADDIWVTANKMAKEYGIKPISKTRVIKAVGAGLNIFLLKLFKSTGKDVLDLRKHYISIYRTQYKKCVRPYKGVIPVLKYLKKKNIKLVIVSNKASFFIKKTLKHLKMDMYFDVVLGRGDLKKDKPHPLPFLHLMKKYKVGKEEMMMVGDSIYDIESANNAGIYSYYVTYGYGNRKEVMALKPDFVSDAFEKIKDII